MKLTPISHAMLGIVAERDCSTYEIVRTLRDRFGQVLRGAERRLYDEPKRLEQLGLLAGAEEWVGERPRIMWSITVEGRIELARWLAHPDATPPSVEFPDLARLLLAEQGSKAHLVAALESIAEAAREWGTSMRPAEFADASDHVDDLVLSYLVGLARYTAVWAESSLVSVRDWRSTSAPGAAARSHIRDRIIRDLDALGQNASDTSRHAR